MTKRCLYCYQILEEGADFHAKCSTRFFGTPIPPVLDFGQEEMDELARQVIMKSIAVTGVQPKISLSLTKDLGDPKRSRLTIVGLWGNYILKPPAARYPFMPENEDLTMHLSRIFEIPTAEHSLIRLRTGELAYITRRFDRVGSDKLAMEDMCQLTETLTEDKYRGSMERIGKAILASSARPGLDALTFFETAFFCFLTGNADMHLKNFSLLEEADGTMGLSPAYDLLCTKMLVPGDPEDLALTLNAKKRKITRKDFDALADRLKIPQKVLNNSYAKFSNKLPEAKAFIDLCFLPQKLKLEYKAIIDERVKATLIGAIGR